EAEAGDFFVGAVDEIAAAALRAGSIVAAVPSNTHALPLLPNGNARSDFVNGAGDFVSGGAGVGHAGPKAVLDKMIAEANAAGLDADADVSGGRLWNVALLKLEVGVGLGDYCDFHFWHGILPRGGSVNSLKRTNWMQGIDLRLGSQPLADVLWVRHASNQLGSGTSAFAGRVRRDERWRVTGSCRGCGLPN